MSQIIKVCRNNNTRRIPIDEEFSLEMLRSATNNAYPDLKKDNKDFRLMWKDAAGDMVVVVSDEDLLEALRYMNQNKVPKSFSIAVINNPVENKQKSFSVPIAPAFSRDSVSVLSVEIRRPCGAEKDEKVRIVTFPNNISEIKFDDLHKAILEVYPGLRDKDNNQKAALIVKWTDNEGDVVTVTSDAELQEALQCMLQHNLPLSFCAKPDKREQCKSKQPATVVAVEDTSSSSSTGSLDIIVCRDGGVDNGGKTRRVAVPCSCIGAASTVTFTAVRAATLKVYPGLERKVQKGKLAFTLTATDNEGDLITVTNDAEIQEALTCMQEHNLPLKFDVVETDLRSSKKAVAAASTTAGTAPTTTAAPTTTGTAPATLTAANTPAVRMQNASTRCVVRRPRTGNKQSVFFPFPTTTTVEGSFTAFKTAAQASISGLRHRQLEELQLTWYDKSRAVPVDVVIASDADLLNAVKQMKQQNQLPMQFDIEISPQSQKQRRMTNLLQSALPATYALEKTLM